MFYLKKRIAQVMAMSIMLTNMPAQATTPPNVLNENYAVNMYKSTTSGGLQITTPPSIELKPVTYIGENYEVTFRIQSKWDGKFNSEFIIKNTGKNDIENWALELDFDHNITQIWNAGIKEHDGNNYVLKNLGYNQDIKSGESVSIGFQAEWKESIKAPEKYELLGTKTEASDEKYAIDFKVTSDWGSAFNGEISITNNGEESIEDWTLEFDFDKNIERFWTAEILEHEAEHYVIKNAGYNANIEPGHTLRLGFSGNPGNVESEPENYILNQVVEEIDYEKDSDGDGLPDFFEEELGTDSNNEDSDGDGLPDGYEYLNLRTDPLKTDTDENGISDAKEDLDEDLLNNEDEYKLNTSPVHCDTDLDGLTDYEEYSVYKTNPLVYDTDNDGLGDGEEIPYNLDPTKQSTYDDGIIDGDRTFEEKIESQQEGTSIKANIIIEGTINEINNSAINMIADDGIYLSKDVPGYIGNAYEFKLDEDIKEATIRFEIDENIWSNSEVIPAIYHWNEDKQLLEKVNVPESRINSRGLSRQNYLQTKIYSSGTYMVLDSKRWEAIWEIELLDNFSQTIGKPGIDIVFSLDESGSMGWNDPSRLRYEATNNFIDVLGEKDEAAIVKFSGSGWLVQGFTNDKDLLKTAVGNYRQSRTAIYRGFEVALDQFDDNKSGQRYLFLLTDGEGSYYHQDDIVSEAKQKGVVIYTIGLGADPDSERLTEIAKATGGRYIGVDNASELESVFAGVSGEIIDYSKDTDADGLNDYYEKKINIGDLRLGDGSKIGEIKYDNKDSDNDTLLDGEELKVKSYATQVSEGKFKTLVYAKMSSSPIKKDTDGDFLDDNIEIDKTTLPLNPDTDGDTLKDGYEVQLGYDPTNSNPDNDHLDDYEELDGGTNPYVYNKEWYEHLWSFSCGVVGGDFNQDVDDYSTLAGQIVGGCIPFIDIRDVIANTAHGDYEMACLSGIGLIPVAGDLSKAGAKAGKFILKNLDNVSLMPDILKLCHNINPDLIKEIEKQTGAISKISDAAKNNGTLLTKADSEFIDKMVDLAKVTITLSKNNIKHVLTNHTVDKVKRSIDMMMGKGLVDNAKLYLKEKSFFNSNWSESQVIEVTTEAFNRAIQEGIPSKGTYKTKFEIFGEPINIVFQDGEFRTAYGEYKFKLSDFGY